MRLLPLWLLCLVSIWLITILSISSCSQTNKNRSHQNISVESIEKGRELAKAYCQSCHMLPEPSWADSKTWQKGILPNMGPRLGIFYFQNQTYPSNRFDISLKDVYPSNPLVSEEQWQNIIDYYTATSPDTLIEKQGRDYPIKKTCDLFIAVNSTIQFALPSITFVKIDSASTRHRIIISDALTKKTYCLNEKLQITDSIDTDGSLVDIEIHKTHWIVCNIGVLNPNNGNFGKVERINIVHENLQKDSLLFSNLARPVQVAAADMNNDGRLDKVVCEFGFFKGRLSLMANEGSGVYKKIVLRDYPGAVNVYVDDYNHDGLNDLWVLFAQGEEGIFLFTNKGQNNFEQKEVLRFPPIYGSSYFELDDFNNDGKPDILYTCGDNADYSTILKPFHGVYIFLNDGKNQFKQKYFFPINGCYKAIAKDFDNDGDLDIATISYFADYKNQPEEGFVYLENKGNYDFLPSSLPQAQIGRWLTMDAGDYNADGKIDLLLGNFTVAPGFITPNVDWKKSPPFLLLKNIGSIKP